MTQESTDPTRSESPESDAGLMFADAALGLAGHEVTDPYLNMIALRFARGELSIEEAGALSDRHLLGR